MADLFLDLLHATPAAVRFVSFEPLPKDLGRLLALSGIGWVIAGAESDPAGRRATNRHRLGAQDL